MNPYYNQNYTREQIESILDQIKNCVVNRRFTISMNENRKENIEFINEYNIRTDQQAFILLHINIDDFCHSLQNSRSGFEHETLYVFVPQVRLFSADGKEVAVDVYTKFNVIDMPKGRRTVVISFHKRNKPIDYLFR